ncbi:eukaryotic translation initiation factor-like protein 3 subunit K [Ascobolus immersus RN42]|uniref:Eukaryotic translation initiation factor 3 subunit K n=1 Tax=Ascobolus immersus RN42 TaxID=1160509 RepID=A0A3N4HU90_ASCIM|nr:eukaryotic translation initiation factor-like protein 3 subunit K [Ascobolus immersus RN42]
MADTGRPEFIETILSTLDRYNPETTSIFQEYVVQQCETRTYDSYANLALLKLYQFNPHLAKDETITNILVKALTKLQTLNDLLEGAAYREFWATLDSDDLYADLVADVQGFEELIRTRIAIATAQAAKRIQREVFEEWVNLRGEKFVEFVEGYCGWSLDGADVVVPDNDDNQAKTTVVREVVRFDQFSRIVKRAYEQTA